MPRATSIRSADQTCEEPVETTLLELVQALGELTDDEQVVVSTVLGMLRSGRVRLCGNFRGQRLASA